MYAGCGQSRGPFSLEASGPSILIYVEQDRQYSAPARPTSQKRITSCSSFLGGGLVPKTLAALNPSQGGRLLGKEGKKEKKGGGGAGRTVGGITPDIGGSFWCGSLYQTYGYLLIFCGGRFTPHQGRCLPPCEFHRSLTGEGNG